jgi:hypothetical protein
MKKHLYQLIIWTISANFCLAQNTHTGTVPAYASRNVLSGGVTDSSEFIFTNNGRVDLKFCMNSSSNASCDNGVVVFPGQTVIKKVIDLGGLIQGDKLNVTNKADGAGSYNLIGPTPGPAPGPAIPSECFAPGPPNSTKIKGAVWTPLSHDNYGIMYTGVNCPAVVGIGTLDPKASLDVRGSGYFSGKVQIGPQKQMSGIHTDALFTVFGKMVAKSCFITINNWADYVFNPDYSLPKLVDVEMFYKANRRLPEIPSEKEVVENGVDLAQMNKLLLMKIEELTLYLVEQQKQIENNKQDIKALQLLIK